MKDTLKKKGTPKKGSVKSRLLAYFLPGGLGTAKDFGMMLGSQDIRKVISDLRKDGWDIQDRWIEGRRKEYWLHPNQVWEHKKEQEREQRKRRQNGSDTKN